MRRIQLENNRVIEIIQGNITEENTDAIVNAANGYLKHGGGVAGAIVRAGGEVIQKQSNEYVSENGPLNVSDVAITGAGKMRARYVIHVHGPKKSTEGYAKLLYKSFYNILSKGDELELSSISIPAVSSGIFGVPKVECAKAFFKALLDYFNRNPASSIKLIRACNIDDETTNIFEEISLNYF
ncbi:MAG: macro domain-containing protein [Kosmotoga sp.]|nr:MAG: macro domain-containing protein [Kosmotoga sp.]